MSKKEYINIIFIYILLVLFSSMAYSQNRQPAPSGQSALDLFSKGNYSAALEQFTALSAAYPRDPLYMYYKGVCLVNLQKDPDKAVVILQGAKSGSGGMKKVPDDVTFYLGRALQLSGNFSEAIGSFKEFSDVAGKRAAKDFGTSKFIQECNERKGAIVTQKPVEKVSGTKDSTRITKNEVKIKQQVNPSQERNDTLESNELPSAGYINLLNEALENQYKADSLVRLGLNYRQQLPDARDDIKNELKTRISESEKSAQLYQNKANDLLVRAGQITEKNEETSASVLTKKDTVVLTDNTKKEEISKPVTVAKDTLTKKTGSTFNEIIVQNTGINPLKDTLVKAGSSAVKPGVQKSPGIFSVFAVNQMNLTGKDEKVSVNPLTDPGLIYRIQLAVFRNQILQSYFKGITPVYGFRNEGSDVTNYYAGMFRRYTDASNALAKVKTSGFKDAFIVALMDRKNVSMERAAVLEKEWGNKPFNTGINISTVETLVDTVPPTLVFRVEALRNKKPLTDDQFENLKHLSGNRGFDVLKNATGLTIYLIGKFLTFESAAEYADLLSRNGYKDVRVVAYLGLREIPVDTARQLFEKF